VESAHSADATVNPGANPAEPRSQVIAVEVPGGRAAAELIAAALS
jgi:hypothetical protein